MATLMDKIGSYNLFNYFVPGVIFALLATAYTPHSFVQPELATGVFVYYFIGMVLSRVGSLVVEPILLTSLPAKEAYSYDEYAKATLSEKKGVMLPILLEVTNTYRTIAAALVMLLLLKMESFAAHETIAAAELGIASLLFLGAVLFSFAFRKQRKYVAVQVKAIIGEPPKATKPE
jgi:hypothetical protein